MYRIIVACVAMFMGVNVFATPYVTNVVAKQRYPWNGLVDVKYEIVGTTNGIKCVYGSLRATDLDTGKVYPASTFVKPLDLSEGVHHAIWDMSADVELVSTNVVFTVSIEKPSLYLVVDLSAGPDATEYPVSEISAEPKGGWTDEYKTTKLVLRLIEPGSFKMNGRYDVILTKPYYIGVFEVTQKQYKLVKGIVYPSFFQGDNLPAERVFWNETRGDSRLHNWPTVKTVDSNSFIGRLQARTGLKFDLPTEAQWEYAGRAGTMTTYSYGDIANGEYMWYVENSEEATHEVGTKLPNAWGLYDMHGNVLEWCLDCVDSEGSTSDQGQCRVYRGGSWADNAETCTVSKRGYTQPNYLLDRSANKFGFRLVCNQ